MPQRVPKSLWDANQPNNVVNSFACAVEHGFHFSLCRNWLTLWNTALHKSGIKQLPWRISECKQFMLLGTVIYLFEVQCRERNNTFNDRPCESGWRVSLNFIWQVKILVQLMILVDNAGGIWPSINHSPWNGVTLADFVMPFFLFIVGVALALAYKVR